MIPTGLIFAVLDCDLDSIEAWNRWYDLEHTPPNIWLKGVMLSRRYVAPPELHAVRQAAPGNGMADRRGSFVTIYTLCEPPADAFATMTTLRDKLYGEDRMNFPAEKKMVRHGASLSYTSGVSATEIKLPKDEVPFVGHTGILIVQRKGSSAAVSEWYRTNWARAVVELKGVHGAASFKDIAADLEIEIVYFEGDPVAQTNAIRAAAPHYKDAEIVADAPFIMINNLDYPWAERMRNSDLPKTVNG
jgi:hypothetical protein